MINRNYLLNHPYRKFFDTLQELETYLILEMELMNDSKN